MGLALHPNFFNRNSYNDTRVSRAIYNAAVTKYAAGNGTKNQGALVDSGTDDGSLWTVSGNSTYEFVNKKNAAANVNDNLRNNGTYGFACYATSTGGPLSLYKLN